MRVRAINKGYIGGKIREAGEKFDIDDATMADERLRPSWVRPVKTVFLPAEVEAPDDDGDDEDEHKADADEGGNDGRGEADDGGEKKGRRGRKPKAEASLEQLPPVAAPDGTGVAEGLGGQAPDWLPQAATK